MLTIGFIGAGKTGTALACNLHKNGYMIKAVASRTIISAEKLASLAGNCLVLKEPQDVAEICQLIFITTPDDIINSIARSVKWKKDQYVVHCSGALSLDVLEPARQRGAVTGSFHPLQSFADSEQAIHNLVGSTFGIEAEEPLLSALQNIVTSLKGNWLLLSAKDKVLYHTAAVLASNYLVTLVKLAADLWSDLGVPLERARGALLPLVKGTVENIQKVGLPNCLTGPIARGDLGTIKKHVEMLQKEKPELLSCYKILGEHTIPLALAKGKINSFQARELKNIFEGE